MSKPIYRIADILHEKAGQYELTIFHRDAIAYPEEIVRQLYVKKLVKTPRAQAPRWQWWTCSIMQQEYADVRLRQSYSP